MLIFIAILCKTWCFQHGMLDYSWVICIFQRMDFGSHRMGVVTGLYGTLGQRITSSCTRSPYIPLPQ